MKPQADFDPSIAAKKLMREARSGALGTLMPGSGDPYCSLVNVATAFDGAPLLLISKLAIHTKNILADSRVSLMLDERKEGDPLEGARVMLMGRAAGHRPTNTTGAAISRASRRRRCSRALPISRSTGSRFRRPIWWRASAASSISSHRTSWSISPAPTTCWQPRERASAHMNEDHADACRLYATKLYGAPDGDWRCAGFDPEGLELQNGRIALRVPFPAAGERRRVPAGGAGEDGGTGAGAGQAAI